MTDPRWAGATWHTLGADLHILEWVAQGELGSRWGLPSSRIVRDARARDLCHDRGRGIFMSKRFGSIAAMRPFYLVRDQDASGVSGTGIVAYGVVLPSGRAVMEWNSPWPTVTVFASLHHVRMIHGHHGQTRVLMGLPERRPPVVGRVWWFWLTRLRGRRSGGKPALPPQPRLSFPPRCSEPTQPLGPVSQGIRGRTHPWRG